MPNIRECHPENEREIVISLFRDYANSLGFDLGFQRFEDELAKFPGDYAAPEGVVLVAEVDGKILACGALRKLEGGVCEMKRLYVKPEARGLGLGRALASALIDIARAKNYRLMRLDTIDNMTTAMRLYESLGFQKVPPYCYNPIPGAVYFELEL